MASTTKETPYPLERDQTETERLNTQHALLVRATGSLLHPSITRSLPPEEPKIAELATGTGIWLIELASHLPQGAKLDGYDISSSAFTTPEDLPNNVSLSILDAKQTPSPELRGRYDAVHIRFMNVALPTDEDWELVARHASALLRPGGALQWVEAGFQGLTTVYSTEPETKTTALERAGAKAAELLGHANWYITHLSPLLTSSNFTKINVITTSTDRLPEDRNPMSKIAIGAIEGLLRYQAAMQMEGALQMGEIEDLVREMREEIDAGAYLRIDMHQFVAFKGA